MPPDSTRFPIWSFRGGGRPLLFGSCCWSSRRGEQNDSQDLHREAGNYDNNPVRLIRTRSRIEEDDRAHRKQEGTYKKAHKPAEFASFARSLTRPSGREGQTRIERYRRFRGGGRPQNQVADEVRTVPQQSR